MGSRIGLTDAELDAVFAGVNAAAGRDGYRTPPPSRVGYNGEVHRPRPSPRPAGDAWTDPPDAVPAGAEYRRDRRRWR